MKRKNLGRAVLVLFLLLPALAVWWPLWFMGTGALMPLDELRAALGPVLQGAEGSAFWPLLPSWPTLQPLAELLLDTPQFFTMFWNTCAIVFPQVLGQVLVGAPAAWAFSRLRFRGRRALFTLYIVLMLMPFQVTMVSGYLVADAMGIMDTFWAIILPGAFSTFPVFIMAKGFDAVPIALLEAASIDGANGFQQLIHIKLPLLAPTTLFLVVTTVVSSMKVFQAVDILTLGGPYESTMVLVYQIYRLAFADHRLDRAAAVGCVFFVILLAFTAVTMKWSNHKVNYDA